MQSGKQHASKHAAPGLWSLLARLGRDRWPALLRGDIGWASEANMARAEQEGLPYLFKLRTTRNVKRLLERAMAEHDWAPGGQGSSRRLEHTTLEVLDQCAAEDSAPPLEGLNCSAVGRSSAKKPAIARRARAAAPALGRASR